MYTNLHQTYKHGGTLYLLQVENLSIEGSEQTFYTGSGAPNYTFYLLSTLCK